MGALSVTSKVMSSNRLDAQFLGLLLAGRDVLGIHDGRQHVAYSAASRDRPGGCQEKNEVIGGHGRSVGPQCALPQLEGIDLAIGRNRVARGARASSLAFAFIDHQAGEQIAKDVSLHRPWRSCGDRETRDRRVPRFEHHSAKAPLAVIASMVQPATMIEADLDFHVSLSLGFVAFLADCAFTSIRRLGPKFHLLAVNVNVCLNAPGATERVDPAGQSRTRRGRGRARAPEAGS